MIGLFSVIWLFLNCKFTRFLNLIYVSLGRRANVRNVRLYYPFWQYINISIFQFRFVSLHCLRRTLGLFLLLVNLSYFDLYLNTAYAAHYVFSFSKTVISLALIDIIFWNSKELHRGRLYVKFDSALDER